VAKIMKMSQFPRKYEVKPLIPKIPRERGNFNCGFLDYFAKISTSALILTLNKVLDGVGRYLPL